MSEGCVCVCSTVKAVLGLYFMFSIKKLCQYECGWGKL